MRVKKEIMKRNIKEVKQREKKGKSEKIREILIKWGSKGNNEKQDWRNRTEREKRGPYKINDA